MSNITTLLEKSKRKMDLKSSGNFNTFCRICLTRGTKMTLLNTSLNSKKQNGPLVLGALEEVMSVKVTYDSKYPKVICAMCLGLLKISYELKLQFLNSTKILQEYFEDFSDVVNKTKEINEAVNDNVTPVEIIVGSNKYDLKDVLIIEENKEEQNDFRGFLNNLGKTVSARFVNKVEEKSIHEELPVVLIENIKNKPKEILCDPENISKSVVRSAHKDIEKYIITQGEEGSNQNLFPNISTDMLNLENISLNNPTDMELFQSAANKQLECVACHKFYSSQRRLLNHLETCGAMVNRKTLAMLRCHLCNRTFKEKKFLNYHIKIIHNPLGIIYRCEICNEELKNKNTYIYHKRTKHAEQKFMCDVCGKILCTLTSLKKHVVIHKERREAQCVCPVCGKTFHYKGGLFYHMKLHTNERKYCCEFCEKRFYSLMAKKRHTLTHTGVRPYSCKFCNNKFFSTGELRKHEYCHTGYRPYGCQYCKKGFTSSYNLKVHLVTHAGEFACEFCKRTFVTNAVLQFHQKHKHKNMLVKDEEEWSDTD